MYFRQGLPLNIQENFFMTHEPSASTEWMRAHDVQSVTQMEYHNASLRAGINVILQKWLERGCAEAPEEIYDILRMEYRELPEE